MISRIASPRLRPRERGFGGPDGGCVGRAGASAIATVAVVVIAVGAGLDGLPAASGGERSPPGSPVSTATGAPESPTAGFPATIFGRCPVGVRAIDGGIAVRGRDLLAGYQRRMMYRPLVVWSDVVAQSRATARSFQWLLAGPESLIGVGPGGGSFSTPRGSGC
jgi:hypothetical protein